MSRAVSSRTDACASRRAAAAGALTAEEAERLIAEWRVRDANGTFFEYGVFFTVAGRKEGAAHPLTDRPDTTP